MDKILERLWKYAVPEFTGMVPARFPFEVVKRPEHEPGLVAGSHPDHHQRSVLWIVTSGRLFDEKYNGLRVESIAFSTNQCNIMLSARGV